MSPLRAGPQRLTHFGTRIALRVTVAQVHHIESGVFEKRPLALSPGGEDADELGRVGR